MCASITFALTGEGINELINKGLGEEFVSTFDSLEGETIDLIGAAAGLKGVFFHFNGSRQVSPGIQYIYVYRSEGEIILPKGVYYIGVEDSTIDIHISDETFMMLYSNGNSAVEVLSTGYGNKVSPCGNGKVFFNMDYEKNRII